MGTIIFSKALYKLLNFYYDSHPSWRNKIVYGLWCYLSGIFLSLDPNTQFCLLLYLPMSGKNFEELRICCYLIDGTQWPRSHWAKGAKAPTFFRDKCRNNYYFCWPLLYLFSNLLKSFRKRTVNMGVKWQVFFERGVFHRCKGRGLKNFLQVSPQTPHLTCFDRCSAPPFWHRSAVPGGTLYMSFVANSFCPNPW